MIRDIGKEFTSRTFSLIDIATAGALGIRLVTSTQSGASQNLPERVNGLKRLLDDLYIEIRDLIIKKDQAISSYNTTVADLEEYRRNRPLIETLKAKDVELERERERRIHLEAKLFEKEYEWDVPGHEFTQVNEELERPIGSPELYNLAKDLLHHPSKHPDVIRTMRQRYGPQLP